MMGWVMVDGEIMGIMGGIMGYRTNKMICGCLKLGIPPKLPLKEEHDDQRLKA